MVNTLFSPGIDSELYYSLSILISIYVFYQREMSIVASQVILHPYVSQALKYGGTNLGRDKA